MPIALSGRSAPGAALAVLLYYFANLSSHRLLIRHRHRRARKINRKAHRMFLRHAVASEFQE
jgi:hypothetical protein